jgi:hypothetical protein
MVGNFPQAFSHIALTNAAFYLEEGINVRRRAHRNIDGLAMKHSKRGKGR